MRFPFIKLALLGGLALAPLEAVACTPDPAPKIKVDRRIKVAPNCSFVDGGQSDNAKRVGANPAVDVGNGKISQVFFETEPCFRFERILFADCGNRDAVLVNGAAKGGEKSLDGFVHPYPPAGAGEVTVAAILAPGGYVRITPEATVGSVVADAKREGVKIQQDLNVHLSNLKRRNRFDPLCGCKLYYPDSPGAKL